MINILEILKKIPNLEDMVFYSPLYGNVVVELDFNSPVNHIVIYPKDTNFISILDDFGHFNSFFKGECMLYPSRQNRDWNKFIKNLRPDLPENTSVLVSLDGTDWGLRKYYKNSYTKALNNEERTEDWDYIIPVNKFNSNDWTFKEEDNYGTAYKS